MELTRRNALAAAVAPLLLAISAKGQGAQNAPVFVHDLPHTPTHKVLKAQLKKDATLRARAADLQAQH